MRFVAVLFGPPGAGKSTAARQFGVKLYDRDDEPWSRRPDSVFAADLKRLGSDEHAAAVVIRTGATTRSRAEVIQAVNATHAWMLDTPAEVCHSRVKQRDRDPARDHAAIAQWWRKYQPALDLTTWPGFEQLDLEAARVHSSVHLVTERPLEQRCDRCSSRHRTDLACWRGRYAARIRVRFLMMNGQVCWMCGARATTVDHRIPRSKGGGDEDSNLRPACKPCNSGRGNRMNPFVVDVVTPRGAPLSSRW